MSTSTTAANRSFSQFIEDNDDRLLPVLWGVAFFLVIISAAVRTDIYAQWWIVGLVLAFLLVMRELPLSQVARIVFLLLGTYLTARYFFWRIFTTLTYNDFFSYVGAMLLFLAELFGMTLYMLSIFVNIQPLRRAVTPMVLDLDKLPSVDILVPSYNEPPDMLEVTLLAALQVRYPKKKLAIYLLDDGGTVEKRNDPDPGLAAEALQRHQTLKALCERIGVTYLTREKNNHAKAGNLNAALQHTHGELILFLDADHVPTVDILEKTVGTFQQDDNLCIVQTPHFFINPDPIEKQNVKIFGRMPSENEMFYSSILHGLDFWNSSFFCGSAAVVRRKHLEAIGGMCTSTVTEDAETSLRLHSNGYNSAYIDQPMISGLQPETYASFLTQRLRWAQGMVQIFMLKNPVLNRSLKLSQRVGYLSCCFYWFFGYARVVFLLAPAGYLVFGLRIYDANLREFLAYALPHLVASMLVADYLFGRVRWAFVSELYEIMQSLFSLPAVVKVMFRPTEPTFMVTPKGEQTGKDFISDLSGPFYVIYVITLAALVFGVFRYFNYPGERDTLYITMSWEILNLILMNAAMGVLLESKQRRTTPRIDADLPAQLLFDGHPAIDCRIDDLSADGAQLLVGKAAFAPVGKFDVADMLAYNIALGRMSRLHLKIVNARERDDGMMVVGTTFVHQTMADKSDAVALAHGDSDRWLRFLEMRDRRLGILKSFLLLLTLGTKYAILHFRLMIEIGIDAIADSFDRMAQTVRPNRRKKHDRRERRVSILNDVVTRLERRAIKTQE